MVGEYEDANGKTRYISPGRASSKYGRSSAKLLRTGTQRIAYDSEGLQWSATWAAGSRPYETR